jgi:hypothetical protein
LGDAPVDREAELVAAEWDSDIGAERLVLQTRSAEPSGASPGAQRNGRIRVLLKQHKQTWIIVGVQGQSPSPPGSDRWWRVQFEDFVLVDGIHMPNTIRFAEPGASFDDGVEIKVKDRRLNPDIPEQSFTLTPPPDMHVQYLGCDDSQMTP